VVKCILDIGNAKYKIDKNSLNLFMQEVRGTDFAPYPDSSLDQGSLDDAICDRFAQGAPGRIFREIMQLYNEYARTENLDVLVKLKVKLEQASSRYKSLVLAEEVLTINSCLPYERRVTCNNGEHDISRDELE